MEIRAESNLCVESSERNVNQEKANDCRLIESNLWNSKIRYDTMNVCQLGRLELVDVIELCRICSIRFDYFWWMKRLKDLLFGCPTVLLGSNRQEFD